MKDTKEFNKLENELLMSYQEYYDNHKDELQIDELVRIQDIYRPFKVEISPTINLFGENGIETYYTVKAFHTVEIVGYGDREVFVETTTVFNKTIESICEKWFDLLQDEIEKIEPTEIDEIDYWYEKVRDE